MSSPGVPEIEIHFKGIDEAEAERVVASMWRVLEEHAIATPLVEVRSARALVDITVRFRSTEDRALVEKAVFAAIV